MSEKNLREHGIDEQADSSGSQEEGQARGSSLFLPTRPIYLRPIPILIITLGAIAFTLALFVQIQKAEQGPLRSSFRSNCISLSYALKQSKESYTESLLMASKMIAVEAHRLGHAFGEVSRNLIQRYPGLELNYVERVSVGEDIQFKVIRSHPGKLQESSELLATRYQQGMSASSGSGLVSEYRYLAEGVSRLELTMPVAPMGGAKGASPKGVMLASIPVSLLISKAFHGLDLTGISVQIWNTEDRNDSPALYSTSARHDHALPALSPRATGDRWTTQIQVADKSWQVSCERYATLAGSAGPTSKLALFTGLSLTGMLLLFIFKSSGHTKSIENLFHELDATHQELEKTHTDLEEAHQELIDNQARIIENEKLTTARSLTQKLVTRLRSPITSLLLALHRSGDHQTEGNRQFCDHIEDAIHRILKLMDQLGRASGLEQPEGTQELIAATRGLDTSLGEATSSQTVLLIEDEDPIRELLTFVITELGYEVDSVATGEEALTRIQEVNYGLILSDINLPGKSGIDVFREVTRTNPDLKFTFMSGYMLKKEWIPVLKESGAFLQKPCSAEDVGKLLKQALGEAKQEPHLASP